MFKLIILETFKIILLILKNKNNNYNNVKNIKIKIK